MFSEIFIYTVGYLAIGIVFCLYNSLVLREIMHIILDHHDISFHTTLTVAFYITVYLMANSLLSFIWWLNIIFIIAFVFFFIFLVRTEYLLTNRESLIMFFWWLIAHIALAALAAGVLTITYHLAAA